MNFKWLIYGLVLGLLPLAVGLGAGAVDPHGDAAQLPWFTMVTLPAGLILGFFMSLFSS
jgi:hypothetical protein